MVSNTTAIVLAAGLGVRMKSSKPKVMHAAAGRTLIDHVIEGLVKAGISKIRVVLGRGAQDVQAHLGDRQGLSFYFQKEQLGTANAVQSADTGSLDGTVLICNGDHPLILAKDYNLAIEEFDRQKCDVLVVSSLMKDPKGFGRIVRNGPDEIEIVEERDATETQRKIQEVNSGLYLVRATLLKKLLPRIKNDNSKKEFYLTDLLKLALQEKYKVFVACSSSPSICRGVNNQVELAIASRVLFRRKARELRDQGVILVDPLTTYIDVDVKIGEGTFVGPGCAIASGSQIGKNCLIESHCQIKDSKISDDAIILWGSLIDGSIVEQAATIGPYARLRPESQVGREAHVGNFVELKKTKLGARVKAGHLTYLGDAEIGENSNIGCGTITCNYSVDRKKYKTIVGKNVFVGSDTQFVAPVTIGNDSVIASGSTITHDVPERALAIARSKQVIKLNYNKKD